MHKNYQYTRERERERERERDLKTFHLSRNSNVWKLSGVIWDLSSKGVKIYWADITWSTVRPSDLLSLTLIGCPTEQQWIMVETKNIYLIKIWRLSTIFKNLFGKYVLLYHKIFTLMSAFTRGCRLLIQVCQTFHRMLNLHWA